MGGGIGAPRPGFAEALRRLATLGFVELLEADSLRLRAGLLRFAEPVRGRGSPAEALERLVARGELVLGDGEDVELEDAEHDGAEHDGAEEEEANHEPAEPELSPQDLSDFDDFGDPLPTDPLPPLEDEP